MDEWILNDSLDPHDLVDAAREAAELLEQLADQHRDLIGPTHARLAHAIALAAPLSEQILKPTELAAWWQVDVSTVRRWIRDGDLEAFNVGHRTKAHWRILRRNAVKFAELRGNLPQSAFPREAS